LTTLGVSKPGSNSKLTGKYNTIKNYLVLLFELQRLEAESTYQYSVLSEQKNLLLLDLPQHCSVETVKTSVSSQLAPPMTATASEMAVDYDEGSDEDEDDDPYAEDDEDGEDGEDV